MFVAERICMMLGMGQIGTAEAAKRLGVTAQHVTRLIRTGELKGEQIGRTWVIDERSVEAFKKRERPGPGRPRKA